jgi:GNAT superfamily N-acetyltransferase
MAHDVVVRRLREADYPTMEELVRRTWYADGDPNISRRLAAIDVFEGLARATHAMTAELNGEVLGVILGSVRSEKTRWHRLPYRLRQIRLLPPLLFSGEGHRRLAEELEILRVDDDLRRETDKTYDAEVALFVVSPAARGKGVGGRLFGEMMGLFRKLGVREYFLFTDTSCDYGFYDHRGLVRRAERHVDADGKPKTFFLYEGGLL